MNDIDKLFKDGLKNLEVKPHAKIWATIEKKKKKRRILPMWWFYGGVAAALFLVFFLTDFSNTTPNNSPLYNGPSVTSTPLKSIKVLKEKKTDRKELVKENFVVLSKNKKLTPSIKFKKVQKENIQPILIAQNNVVKKELLKKKFEKKRTIKAKDSLQKKIKDTLINIQNSKKDFIVQQKTKKINSNNKLHKWLLTPVVTSSFSNSFATATVNVNQNLQSNSSYGNNSLSFGIKIAYQLNDKFQIQSGIHILKKDYSTKNTLKLDAGFSRSEIPNAREIVLNQKYQYLEFPLELKYQVAVFKKTSINIFTGLSFLFLTENQIIEKTAFTSNVIGESRELNSFNFSGNIGVDFNYSINNQWGIQLSPFLKIEKKSFINSSYQFKPYVIGASFGINYKL